jgi:ATP-binding cassette subfamily F protein uup
VAVGPTVRFAAIDQARSDLAPEKTVLEEVAGGNDYVVVGGRGLRVETFLEQFLFPGAMKHARVGALSGGERNRVLLAKLLCQGGNVLVLDEPTNDLDLASLRALEDALLAFPGAAILVSHDRWFLDRVATRILHLDGAGGVRQHAGDLSLLLERLAAEAAAAARAAPAKAGPAPPRSRPARLSTREQAELAALPDRIDDAERALAAVDRDLHEPSLWLPAARQRQQELTQQRQALAAEVAALYARWEELEARRAGGG